MSSNLYVILEYVVRIGLASSLEAHWELTGNYLGARHSCGYSRTKKTGIDVACKMLQIPGRNTLGTWFGETGLKIRPDVLCHDNCEQIYLTSKYIFFSHKKEKGSKTHLRLKVVPM